MIGIDERALIDLQAQIRRVLKETIVRIEHFMRQQEEPLACHASIVESLLALERQEQLSSQIIRMQLHYLIVRVVKQISPRHLHLDMALECVRLAQIPKLGDLPLEVPLIGQLATRILERSSLIYMVNKQPFAFLLVPNLPALHQHRHLTALCARILPLGRVILMIDIVGLIINIQPHLPAFGQVTANWIRCSGRCSRTSATVLVRQSSAVEQVTVLQVHVLLALVLLALVLPVLVVGHAVYCRTEPGGCARIVVYVVGAVLAVEAPLPVRRQVVVDWHGDRTLPGCLLSVVVEVVGAVVFVEANLPARWKTLG